MRASIYNIFSGKSQVFASEICPIYLERIFIDIISTFYEHAAHITCVHKQNGYRFGMAYRFYMILREAHI